MSEIDFEKINVELLNENTDLNEFSCKINDLTDFLKYDAVEEKKLYVKYYICGIL